MRIRLLGPVEVEAAGGSLDVGPRQRRAVLAALAIDAGTPVPIDIVAQRVWGVSKPQAPRSALYAHVARLRQVLSAAERNGCPISLSRRDDGYVLDVDRQLVDVHRLSDLIGADRDASPADVPDRLAALREAIDLWRGPPLPTLATAWAVQVRRRVVSQLISVAGAWAAEELRVGNADVVADRLARILGSYPLAETLVAARMRALCATGRTAEALQCYAETRAQIAERLGAEPGAELRDLHIAVLRGEFDTPSPHATAARTTGSVPRQLPAHVVRFSGRDRDLVPILDWLSPTGTPGAAPVVALYGAAGVGKSTLAIHAAHQLAHHFPDGQLYLDLRGYGAGASPLRPVDALARLLRSLGVTPAHTLAQADEAAALFRSTVAGRRFLLVLDNAQDANQVRPLLPGGIGSRTLVTSRQALTGLSDVCQVRVAGLAVDDAVALLARWVGADRVAAEPAAAAAIARWCECLPLALRIAGARLAARPGWPLAELRDRLADENRRLDNLESAGDGLRASLAGSYQRLFASTDLADRATAQAFKVLSMAGMTELSRAAAAQLLARPEHDTEHILERLVDAQLLESPTPGTYRMGALLRLAARERFAGACRT